MLYKTSDIRDPKDYEDWMGRHSSLSLSLKRHYFEGVPGYCMLRQGVSTEYV